MSIFDRKPVLRWVAPLAFLAVVGGTGGLVSTATAKDALPEMSAQDLLVNLQKSKVDTFSGTLVQNSDLGIPALPGVGGSDDASLTSLVSGTHTMDVWFAGPDKARLRVHGKMDESDVIVNGSDVWHWSYKDKTATHRKITGPSADAKADLETRRKAAEDKAPADLPKTPQEAAERALKAIEPTTKVSTARTDDVAGEQVYELVLEPQDADSLVSQIRIAVDGDNFMPLRVQVLAQDDPKPAFQVAYTDIDFDRPDERQFDFKAPEGTEVKESSAGGPGKAPSDAEVKAHKDAAAKADKPKIVGSGWSSVMVAKLPASAADQADGQLGQVLASLPTETGAWGSGKVLSGKAFTAVLTDDGRIAVGSVKKDKLLEALGK